MSKTNLLLILLIVLVSINIAVSITNKNEMFDSNESLASKATETIADDPKPIIETLDNTISETDRSTETENTNKKILFATVNGSPLYQEDVISALNKVASQEQISTWRSIDNIPEEVLSTAINNAALDRLLLDIATQNNLYENPAIINTLKENENQIIKTTLLNLVKPNLVSEEQIKTEYNALAESLKGQKEIKVRHILLATEKEANIIDEALKQKKKTFAELAKLFSLDESTAINGGDLGYVIAGQLNAEFEKEISNLNLAEVSAPFETPLGWHIAIVDDRRNSEVMPLEQASPVIRDRLEQQAIQNYLNNLLSTADIRIIN